jgi:hypothetical protein
MNTFLIRVLVAFLFFGLPVAAQDGPVFVNLTVVLNGKIIPPPDEVTFAVDNRSITVKVRDGRFEVPHDILVAKGVAFTAVVASDQIKTRGFLYSRDFGFELWKLILADRRFPDNYAGLMLKHEKAGSTCMFALGSKYHEGFVEVVPQCRTKVKAAGGQTSTPLPIVN